MPYTTLIVCHPMKLIHVITPTQHRTLTVSCSMKSVRVITQAILPAFQPSVRVTLPGAQRRTLVHSQLTTHRLLDSLEKKKIEQTVEMVIIRRRRQ